MRSSAQLAELLTYLPAGFLGDMTTGAYAGMARDLLILVANFNYGKGVGGGGLDRFCSFQQDLQGKFHGTCNTDRAAVILKMNGCCRQED